MEKTKQGKSYRLKQFDSRQPFQREMKRHQLLLICNDSGVIVFASGDPTVFCSKYKLQDLHHKKLFDLGFTQTTLGPFKKEYKQGLMLSFGGKMQFKLELINAEVRAQSKTEFYQKRSHFLKKIDFKCSLLAVKFNQAKIQPKSCNVKRVDMTNFQPEQNQHSFILFEVTLGKKNNGFQTQFEDYTETWLTQPAVKIQTKLEAELKRSKSK